MNRHRRYFSTRSLARSSGLGLLTTLEAGNPSRQTETPVRVDIVVREVALSTLGTRQTVSNQPY